jgi:HAD superfamily hydrolase (TIGR01509 family)
MTLKALIFDVDGTLAETEHNGHRCAFNAAFADAGLDWHWGSELYGELLAVGGGRERIEAYMAHYKSRSPRIESALVDELHASKARHYVELMERGDIPLRSGVYRLIAEEARAAGLKLAVATNSSGISLTCLTLRYFGATPEEIFDVVVCGDILKSKKPAPDAYQIALEALGLSAAECLAFEDSYVGLHAASQVSVPTVVTVSKYTAAEDFSAAALVVSELGDDACCLVSVNDPYAVLDDQCFVTIAMLRALHQRVCAAIN